MDSGSMVMAGMFALLALAHSAAGETGFVRPLLNADWTIAEVPRPIANRLLRGAWHLTSVAWLAMAVIAIGGTPLTAMAVAALVSGVVIFLVTPAHFAWPLFIIAGGAGLEAEGLLTTAAIQIIGGMTIIILGAAALVHLYWAAGGRALVDAAIPTTEDNAKPTISPGPVATAAVAAVLTGFAGLLVAELTDLGPAGSDTPVVRWLIMAGIAVLTARAIGDGRYAGFSKKFRDSAFGEMDDRFFTPIVVTIALGATTVLLG